MSNIKPLALTYAGDHRDAEAEAIVGSEFHSSGFDLRNGRRDLVFDVPAAKYQAVCDALEKAGFSLGYGT